MMKRMLSIAATVLLALPLSAQDWDAVEMVTESVGDNLYVLHGAGGNIGLWIGEDGVFLIDDQFAPLTDKILAAIAALSDQPIRFLINTHYHGDHTGGNENLGRRGTLIVAHDKLRRRLQSRPIDSSGGWTAEGPAFGLPSLTFNDQMSFHLNGAEARIIHVPHAHTDGDAIVHFMGANVFHVGDLLFNGLFPYIDVDAGGNVEGVIRGVEQVLALADEETTIIGGHGPVATTQDLRQYHTMLKTVRDRVAVLIADGKSLDQVLAAAPSKEYDEDWTWGFIDTTKFVTSIYRSLAGN